MSLPNIASSKRIFKIKKLFEPYQFLSVFLNENQKEAIIVQRRRDSRGFLRHIACIPPALLHDDSPSWVEVALLEYMKKISFQRSQVPLPLNHLLHKLNSLLVAPPIQPSSEVEHIVASADEAPLLLTKWQQLRAQYFPELPELDKYTVRWSNRHQLSSLASCNVERKRVEIAKALDAPQYVSYVEALLYHEMCHAALGRPPVIRGRRVMHGKDFHRLEKRHPLTAHLNSWIKSGGWQRASRR